MNNKRARLLRKRRTLAQQLQRQKLRTDAAYAKYRREHQKQQALAHLFHHVESELSQERDTQS